MKNKQQTQKGKKRSATHSARPADKKRRKGTPSPIAESEKITGRIDAGSKGFGFLVRDDGGEDLFVPARDMGTALGGDRVTCVRTGHNRGAGEARVTEILERAHTHVVGTLQVENGACIVVADNPRLGSDIYVKPDRCGGARAGQKVVVRLVAYPPMRRPEGEVEEVLGYPDEQGVDMRSIIRAHDLSETFSDTVLQECAAIPDTVPTDKTTHRTDFRNEPIVTIDGDDSRDFDDAVTVSRTKGGGYRLGVHIADVAEYVRRGTRLDAEAYERGTSVYFPDRVLPMLPEKLSNGVCSLNEGEDRLTLSVVMELDAFGSLQSHTITEGVIRSRARLTYTKVAKILDGDAALREEYAPLVPMLEDLRDLAARLRKRRTERGNIEFDIPECGIELDERGRVTNVVRREQLVSHKIIEECMLLCNETVAEAFVKAKAPFVFRAHAAPPAEKVQNLIGFVSALGLTFRGDRNEPKSIDFARFLSSLDPSVANVVNRVALRSMSKATYEPNNIGHFGLAAPYYCHFTSPIRRYPDLMIHRIIKDYLHNGAAALKKYAGSVGEISKHCSEREKAAEAAERKADDCKKAEFMRGKIGEEYEGVVSGVTEWGIFAELPNTVEGLIRTENLPGDGYVFNAELYRLDSPAHTFKLGDAVRIRVEKVVGDRVSFTLCD